MLGGEVGVFFGALRFRGVDGSGVLRSGTYIPSDRVAFDFAMHLVLSCRLSDECRRSGSADSAPNARADDRAPGHLLLRRTAPLVEVRDPYLRIYYSYGVSLASAVTR